ncbi:MAG: hypothetical protein Q4D60_02700 [Eubacteriales bacterium]|nr:hypothetical protein [Eubacteriales bacterium]
MVPTVFAVHLAFQPYVGIARLPDGKMTQSENHKMYSPTVVKKADGRNVM